jgi:hypothetical protein
LVGNIKTKYVQHGVVIVDCHAHLLFFSIEKVYGAHWQCLSKQNMGHGIRGSIISDLLRRVFAAQNPPRTMPMPLATI